MSRAQPDKTIVLPKPGYGPFTGSYYDANGILVYGDGHRTLYVVRVDDQMNATSWRTFTVAKEYVLYSPMASDPPGRLLAGQTPGTAPVVVFPVTKPGASRLVQLYFSYLDDGKQRRCAGPWVRGLLSGGHRLSACTVPGGVVFVTSVGYKAPEIRVVFVEWANLETGAATQTLTVPIGLDDVDVVNLDVASVANTDQSYSVVIALKARAVGSVKHDPLCLELTGKAANGVFRFDPAPAAATVLPLEIPINTFQVVAAPDGQLYANAADFDTEPGPVSFQQWRREATSTWTNLGDPIMPIISQWTCMTTIYLPVTAGDSSERRQVFVYGDYGSDRDRSKYHVLGSVSSDDTWLTVPGKLSQISVGVNGDVWGISGGKPAVFVGGKDPWRALSASLTRVEVGDAADVWGLDAKGVLYRLDSDGGGFSPDDTKLRFVDLSVGGDGEVWGIESDGQVMRRHSKDGSWSKQPTGPAQLAVGNGDAVWGVAKSGQILRLSDDGTSWTKVAGSMHSLTVGGDGTTFGLNAKGQVSVYGGEKAGWHLLTGRFSQISAGSHNNLWALDKGGGVSRHALSYDPPEQNARFLKHSLFCAEMSALAYCGETEIRADLNTRGYALRNFYDTKMDTQAFLAYSAAERSVVLSFRGTWGFSDYSTDLWLEQVPLDPRLGEGVRVIAGFLAAYGGMRTQLMADLEKLVKAAGGPVALRRFSITGHSLGGALAVYAAMDIAGWLESEYGFSDDRVLNLTTIAAPPVGNLGFRMFFEGVRQNLESVRIFNNRDPVATGDISLVVPFIHSNLEKLGYYQVESAFEIASVTGSPAINHSVDTYIKVLESMQNRSGITVGSLEVSITTGTGSVAPWWWPFDGAGTDRDITFKLGQPGGVEVVWDLDNAGNDFEAGQTDTFVLSNPRRLTLLDLKQFTLTIDVSGGLSTDNWILDGIKIVANGRVIYNRQNMHDLMGGDYEWWFTDKIPQPVGGRLEAPLTF